MFPVAHAHCILATKFACSFFNDVSIEKSLKVEKENTNASENQIKTKQKASYKMIFQPKHAEDISYVYVFNQIFESVSNIFAKQISKSLAPTYGFVLFC